MRRFLWLLMAAYAGLSQSTSQPAFEVASVTADQALKPAVGALSPRRGRA
jgi:hypothetical protein